MSFGLLGRSGTARSRHNEARYSSAGNFGHKFIVCIIGPRCFLVNYMSFCMVVGGGVIFDRARCLAFSTDDGVRAETTRSMQNPNSTRSHTGRTETAT